MNPDLLILTESELAQAKQFPGGLPSKWLVQDETSDAYETDEQLEIRFQMSGLKNDPATKAVIAAFEANSLPETLPLETLSQESLTELYFTIGARGLTALIAVLLPRCKDDEDLQMLSNLSVIRHQIFLTNEEVSDSPSPLL